MIRRPIYDCSAAARHLITPLSTFSRFLSEHKAREPKASALVSNPNPKSPIGSPTRVQKLIASQSDPFLAKEIFDYASQQPNFRHSQSSHLILILKLGRARYFNLIDDVLAKHRSSGYPLTGEIFTYLIKVYTEAKLPEKVLSTFYKMLEFNFTPQPKHLNRILEVLVSHRGYLQKAFELFKSSRLHGVMPNTRSYNILMQAFCLNDDLSIAYQLFGKMLDRDVVPDVESYKILIKGFCRKGQVNGAMELLEDMLNKGFVPHRLSCNPDLVHYNTIILGFCREDRAMDARKVLDDMLTLIGGLCDQGMFDEGKKYLQEMISKGFSPHFSVSNCLVKGFCSFGKVEEACDVVEVVMKNGETLHSDTWEMIIPLIYKEDESEKIKRFLEDAVKEEITGDTRIVDVGIGLGSYLSSKLQMKRKNKIIKMPEIEQDDAAAETVDSSTVKFGTPEALEYVRSLTDVGAMTRLLHECIAYQRSLDSDLDTLLSQRTELDRNLVHLQRSAEILDIVKADADHMLGNVRSTCDLADQVSGKVRELDLAQSRVNVTLSRIDAIVERGNCIEGVKAALESEDYESAAKFVQRFLQIDSQYKDSGSDQREQLLASKKQLEGIAKKKLLAAIDQRDHPTILRFVRLYSPLGMEEEGLQLYVGYLKKVIAMRGRMEYENVVELMEQGLGQANFVGCLANLFKDIVMAIVENDEILRGLCGEDGVVYAICELQEECDSRGSLILKKYMEFRKLARLASDINNSPNLNLLAGGASEGPDPREVELYVEEILSLMQIGEDYTEFVVSKIKSLTSVDPELLPRATKAFRNGSFCKVIQDVTGFYVILEGFFMVENVRKAIRIDEHVPDSLTTSMVDDVFYVLQSCLRRAISTSNISSVIAVLSNAGSLLGNDYHEALQQKIREPNLGARLFLGGIGVENTGTEIATALNNMDVSCEYIIKLKIEIEEQCTEVFPAPADRERIKSCLSELGELSNTFKQLLNSGMEQLVATVTPRIRPVLDTVATISYELTETEYAENEVNDPWVQRLLHSVETNAAWLQPLMTSNNYDSFLHLIIDFIVKRLEVIMMQKRFSQLGGLQLDRDTRALVSHFSGMTQRTVRDKFARLTQMATILNLEKVSEILDFWGENSGPMTWRLTPAEVRRVLGLRVEFKPESISALKL
ncbi:Pentatricopeptide repeat [Arabidopsis suecica]|uniref:Conserved oligomeric Golgi complex subunit 4 n=1 Tax=Arabidopsis suecica TaxID=45249 RepID=A0A8T1ZFJ2_ARASU|nr:Pentatricopeptide repeat [Arabidopsis suecica]